MTRKTLNLFMVVLLVALTAAACSKSASEGPQVTPTSLGELPFPLATQPNIMNEILFGTQTAEAMAHEMPLADATLDPTLIIDLSENTPMANTTPMPQSTTASGTSTVLEATVAATSTQAAIPTRTPGVPESYTIHKGEFPYCIARRFDVSAADLLNLNGLGANTQVAEGTVLKIPQNSSWTSGDRALKSHPTSYTVSAGETIYTIACEFGDVDPNDIIAANNLESPYTLSGGTTLQIP